MTTEQYDKATTLLSKIHLIDLRLSQGHAADMFETLYNYSDGSVKKHFIDLLTNGLQKAKEASQKELAEL